MSLLRRHLRTALALAGLALALLSPPAHGQSGQGGSNVIGSVGAPTGTCGTLQLDVDTTTGNLYTCDGGTWVEVTGGGGGSGTVTSVSSGNLASLFTVSVATPTVTPAFSFAFATGQTSHEVIGTCGAATTVSLCALVAGDIPTLNQSTTGNAATATALAATPTLCSTGSAPTGVLANGNATGCATLSGGGTVTTFSAGTLSPLFTTSVATPTSTPALTFALSNAAQNSVFAGPATGGAGAPSYQTAPTISAANMTNFPAAATTYPGAGVANSTGSAWGTSYTVTGTGTVLVAATSPTLVTPALGTPSSVNLSNATNLPCAAHPALTGAVTTSAGSCATTAAATIVQTNQANTYSTGAQDFTGATSILVPTQTAGDSSTKSASTAFVTTAVNNAIAGVNPAVAVLAASTANITGTYTQVGGGVGDTFTVTATGAFTLDGIAINTIGQRILLKNQSTASQNGIYTATVVGTTGVSAIFTRALDYDTPSDVNNTGAIPVQSGTANTTTSWLLTSQVTSIGSAGSSLTYALFSLNPNVALPIANGGTAATTASAALINLLPTASEVGDLVYCATFSSGCTSWALLPGNTSGTQYLQETSSGVPSWTTPSGSGASKAFVTSQFTTTNTSGANVTGLSFTVAANTNYQVTCNLVTQTSATTVGPFFYFSGPGTPTAIVYNFDIFKAAGTVVSQAAHGTAYGATVAVQPTYTSMTASTDLTTYLQMSVINVTGGTIQLVTGPSAAGTITIQAGSSCVMN
jgi:hypothetical protein